MRSDRGARLSEACISGPGRMKMDGKCSARKYVSMTCPGVCGRQRGSSRQLVVVVEGKSVKARLISSRETARLMGLPDDYRLPENYNEAYHLTGDGVVVPVVRHLAKHIFEPVLNTSQCRTTVAA